MHLDAPCILFLFNLTLLTKGCPLVTGSPRTRWGMNSSSTLTLSQEEKWGLKDFRIRKALFASQTRTDS